ncbi:MAG: hypothetical protein ABIH23_10375, partial [bacterium]
MTRQISLMIVEILWVLCFAAIVAHAAVPTYPLFPDGGRLAIQDDAGTVSLAKLEAISPGHERAWIKTEPDVPIWTITILDPDRNKHTVTALDGKGTVRAVSADRLVMEWNGLPPGGLRVVAEISVSGSDLVWKLETELSGPGYILWDIVYPEIGPISLHGDAHSIEPWGWGVLRKDLMDRRDERTYPSAAQAMPFVAVSDGETGLYIGAHDREGYPMKFIMGKRENED